MSEIVLVVAIADNGVIGKAGAIPWHISEDLKRFKAQTMGKPMIMGRKPCIRAMRITVGTIVGLVASGASFEEILQLYSYLESDDIRAAVAYAAWRSAERETPLQTA